VNQILEHRVLDLPHAISKLDSLIAEPPLYVWQTKLACYTIASACVAPLFFHGSLIDGLLAGLIGLFAGGLWVLADVSYILGKVGLVTSAFLSSFLGTVLSAHIPGSCALAIHFGPITYLLPGWSITCSVIGKSRALSIPFFLACPAGNTSVRSFAIVTKCRESFFSFLPPLPSLSSSRTELSTQNMLSGTTRMMTALMNALLLGFGLDLGKPFG
jgi:uncharacterized membrane protein YjjP (DUF1212 family)